MATVILHIEVTVTYLDKSKSTPPTAEVTYARDGVKSVETYATDSEARTRYLTLCAEYDMQP